MKAVIQRVLSAKVSVGEEVVSSIGRGLCVFVGISGSDEDRDLEHMVRKILNVRLFEDDQGRRWGSNVRDRGLEVLCVSQFTLQATLKGNKPDFHGAMPAAASREFYGRFIDRLRSEHQEELVKDGKFGAYMTVHIENDGPVTMTIESPPRDAV